jgi:hypothetical protein
VHLHLRYILRQHAFTENVGGEDHVA